MTDTIPPNDAAESLEPMARAIFTQALRTPGASGYLLWRLFEGDGVTMDPFSATRQIVFLPASMFDQLRGDDE